MASKLQACRCLLSPPPTRRSHYATLMTNSLSWQRWARITSKDETTSKGTFNGLFPFNTESAVPGQLVLRLNAMLVTLNMDSLKAVCWYVSQLIRFVPLCVFCSLHRCELPCWCCSGRLSPARQVLVLLHLPYAAGRDFGTSKGFQ